MRVKGPRTLPPLPALAEVRVSDSNRAPLLDRTMAFSLSGQSPAAAPVYSAPGSPAISIADLVGNLSFYDSDEENSSPQASSSRTATSRPRDAKAPAKSPQDCVICTDPIRGSQIRAPCGHYYDATCLGELFRGASVDESLFPPRCCNQQFVVQEVRRFLGEKLYQSFQTKALEFGTANRVYCHQPSCSAFLGAATPTPVAFYCTECHTNTCGQCKQNSHGSRPCETERDREVLALAEQEGWRRCPGCSHLVELAHGCYHMTCRCRKQFCYLCGADWKTCGCPQWEENRLLNAAAVRVERQNPRAANPLNVDFGRLVREEAERLRTNHDCQHQYWRYRSGGGRCESCSFMLPMYLFRCAGCQMLACNRCRRNRL
ncbi:IBR domain-containing protein [Phanerochaete sordida]|uniref:RBR-type E3 ubiquitin transferase n=1 Tax=Phanerochaete sordida TaxID=48140 RepID=A0A9P3G109_9APHY|nr:IBR domain-containing protein [Phanerochaete sordida]